MATHDMGHRDAGRTSAHTAAETPGAAVPAIPSDKPSAALPSSAAGASKHPANGPVERPAAARSASDLGRRAKRATWTRESVPDGPLDAVWKNGPPWLVSSLVHLLLLIILGLWVLGANRTSHVELSATYAERLGVQLEDDTLDVPRFDNDLTEEPLLTPDNLPMVDDPLARPAPAEMVRDALQAMSQQQPIQVGLALSGRQIGMKRALLAAYGGNATTEEAVMRALRWLARNQRKDGSWSLQGPYKNGSRSENREAATAMALLAFQGAGYTHLGGRSSPFRDVVAGGWEWLLGQQDTDGSFFRGRRHDHRFYTQAQCTIAVCEMYGMTRDERFKTPAQRAVDYCVQTQDVAGGWRYSPGSESDLSVTGWVVMGLQSAKMAGIEVPYDTWRRIERFLDLVSEQEGRLYSYQPSRGPTPAMTAEGLLCRQYLGWWRDDERLQDGAAYLLEHPINWSEKNVYYWYYATQVCHHMEGEYWKEWNAIMRQMLPTKQKRLGADRGSWDPDGDQWGRHGGRLFQTCLSAYMLEVYYRHLPIYQYRLFDAKADNGAGE